MYVGTEIVPLEGPTHPYAWQKAEGPLQFPKFFNQRWTFHLKPNHNYSFSIHKATPAAEIEKDLDVLAHMMTDVLLQIYQEGASLDSLIMFHLKCTGMDSTFGHFQKSPETPRLRDLLKGPPLMDILLKFARMIQSGKKVVLDDHTRITLYSFDIPQ